MRKEIQKSELAEARVNPMAGTRLSPKSTSSSVKRGKIFPREWFPTVKLNSQAAALATRVTESRVCL
jgi:hypothetical protein